MLDFPLERSDAEVHVMELLFYVLGDVEFEDEFVLWNPYGIEEDVPNFWYKPENYAVEWHRDDPGRGTFSSRESDPEYALFILEEMRRYAIDSGRKET